jgi:hypothetical protein
MRKPDPKLLEFLSREFLSRYDAKVRDLMLGVRRIVLKEIPSVSETVNDVSYAVTVGFTFSGRFKEAFCYVVAYSSYVNLGFAQGAQLPDPDRRLKGTGKLNRHLRIETLAGLDDPEILRLIRRAADRAEVGGGGSIAFLVLGHGCGVERVEKGERLGFGHGFELVAELE